MKTPIGPNEVNLNICVPLDNEDNVNYLCGLPVVKSIDGTLPKKFVHRDNMYELVNGAPKQVEFNYNEFKGLIEMLWDIFGGSIVNGYKTFDPRVVFTCNATQEKAKEINKRLMQKGFSPITPFEYVV